MDKLLEKAGKKDVRRSMESPPHETRGQYAFDSNPPTRPDRHHGLLWVFSGGDYHLKRSCRASSEYPAFKKKGQHDSFIRMRRKTPPFRAEISPALG